MQSIFTPPKLLDGESNNKAIIFHKMIIATMIIAVVAEIIDCILLPQNFIRWIFFAISYNLISLGLLYINKRGNNKTAAIIFVSFAWILLTVLAWTGGGIHASIVQTIPILIIAIGLIIGWRESIIVAVISILVYFGIAIAEINNILPPTTLHPTPISLWVNFVVRMGLIFLLQYMIVVTLNKSLKQTQKELQLRIQTEAKLQISENFRKQVFESSRIPIIVMNSSTFKYIDCNNAAIKIYQFASKEETLGKTPLDVSAEIQYDGTPSLEKARYYIEKAKIEGSIIFEWKHQRANGEQWDAEVHLISFQSDNETFLQFSLLDITERKRTEEQLLQEQKLNKAIMNSVPGMLYLYDNSGKLVRWNHKYETITGYSPEEISKINAFEWFKEQTPQSNNTQQNIDAHFNNGYFETEVNIIAKNGKTIPFYLTGVKVIIGNQTYTTGIGLDITQLKQSEEQLREKSALLEAQINSSPDGILVIDEHQKRIIVNQRINELFNVPQSILDNEDDTALLHHVVNLTKQPKIFLEKVQYLYNHPNESSLDIIEFTSGMILQRYSAPVLSKIGKHYGRIWAFRDITEQKLAEAELLHSEAQFRSVLENISLIGLMLDCQGRIILCNDYLLQLTGWNREDVLFQNWFDYFLPDDIRTNIKTEVFQKSIYNGEVASCFENKIKTKNKEERIISWNNTILRNKNKEIIGIASIGEDITERRRNEAKITGLSNIIQNSLNEVYIFDTQTLKFRFANNGALKNIGYSADEICNLTPIDIKPEFTEKDFRAKISELLSGSKDILHFFTVHQRKNGSCYPVDVHLQLTEFEESQSFVAFIIDITEQRHAEHLLLESETSFKTIFERTSTGYVLTSPEGTFLQANTAMENILGYTNKELLLINFQTITHNDDLELSISYSKKLLSGQADTCQFEKQYIHKNGSVIWTFVNVSLVRKKDGTAQYFITSVTDITERKKAELALKNSEERLKEAQRIAVMGNWELNLTNNVLFWSDEIYQIFEINAEQFGASYDAFINAIHPDDRKMVDSAYRNSLETHSKYEISHRLLMPDGRIKHVHERCETFFDDQNKPIRSVGTVQDITEQQLAEEAIIENEELFKNLIMYAPYPIALTDLDNRFVLVNHAYCHLNKIDEKNILGKTLTEQGFKISIKQEEELRNEIKTKGKIENLELTVFTPNGEEQTYIHSTQTIQWKKMPMMLHSSIDITEKKKTERELEKYRNHLESLVKERTDALTSANEELQSTNEELIQQKERLQTTLDALSTAQTQLLQSEKMASLGVLSAGIAHEINNPLNFIHGGCVGIENYFKHQLPDHIEKVNPLLHAINVGVKRASDIVTSLSRYSRRDDSLNNTCNLHAIIDNCLIMLQTKLKNKITINKQYTQIAFEVLGSEGKLHQALLNIISNAEQAIETSGTIEIETQIVDNQAQITIKDSGQGIEEENLQKIFDPFFTTKAPGKGTGLGLSITYNIIHEHSGTIKYYSQRGIGTTVIINLPIFKV